MLKPGTPGTPLPSGRGGRRCVVAYSGGKDSHLALLAAVERGLRVEALVYFDGGERNRDFFHDNPRAALVRAHGRLAGIPVRVLDPRAAFAAGREAGTAALFSGVCAELGVKTVYCGATGEDDNTAAMRASAASAGLRLEAPLEKLDFAGVLSACAESGVRARIVGVEKGRRLRSWLGREAGPELAEFCRRRGAPDGNDFQTVVLESPLFGGAIKPLSCGRGETRDQLFLEVTRFRVERKKNGQA